MAERRENSVLFSLRELRGIEDDRVKTEEEAEQARVEAERQAREDEIRRAKEAAESARRSEEERLRRIEEDQQRQRREDELRLQESERRAQIEAAAKLEQHRIESEAHARMAAKKLPVKAIVAGVAALVLLSGGVMTFLIVSHNQEAARNAAALAAAEKEKIKIAAEADAEKARIKKELSDLQTQLATASDDAEKAKIRARMEAVASRPVRTASSKPKTTDGDKPKPKINTKTDDPLSGLGL